MLKDDLRAGIAAVGAGRLLGLAGLGFMVLFSYEVARPTVESLYQDAYGSENEPWAWLGVAVAVTFVVSVYGRFAARIPLHRLFGMMTLISAVILSFMLLAHDQGVAGTPFVLYLWKDIYIVLLVEMFWSIANSTFPHRAAKWLYGIFSCVGGIGAFAGGRFASWLADERVGLEASLWWVCVILGVCYILTRYLPQVEQPKDNKPKADLFAGLKVVKNSRYLGLLLVIIALTQVAITCVDYDFKIAVQAAYADKLVRQGILADIYSVINVLALVLGLVSGAIIQFVGLRNTLIGIPLLLGAAVLGFLVMPVFAVMVVAKVASKAMDYSIFRAAKELLYLPLSAAEKTQGKAVVDMMTYRVAKGGASALLLAMKEASAAPRMASVAGLVLIVAWLFLTRPVLQRYRERIAQDRVESQ